VPESFSDLESTKLILTSPRSISEELKQFFQKEKFQRDSSIAHACNDIEGVYQSVRANLGIGMLLDISVEREVQEGAFTALFAERSLPRKRLYLLYKKSQWTTQKNSVQRSY